MQSKCYDLIPVIMSGPNTWDYSLWAQMYVYIIITGMFTIMPPPPFSLKFPLPPLLPPRLCYFPLFPSLPHPPALSWETVRRYVGRSGIKADGESREREIKSDRGRKRMMDGERERSRVHRQAMGSQVKKSTAHSSRPAELLHSLIYNNCKYSTTVGSRWCYYTNDTENM